MNDTVAACERKRKAKAQAIGLASLLGCILLGCTSKTDRDRPGDVPRPTQPVSTSIQLHDVTRDSGIRFVHCTGQSGKFLLPETMSGGLALFDYDNDGLIDVYFCSGRKLTDAAGQLLDTSSILLDPSSNSAGYASGALYRNLGNWRFADVTESAGLAGTHFGLGVTAADFDNDGHVDIFLSNFGGDLLFHNDGSGHFVNVTAEIVDALEPGFSAGASFVDVNRDGHLDLFVARYVQFSTRDVVEQAQLKRTQYPGPQDFPPARSQLLVSTGERGQWQNTTAACGMGAVSGTGMGCTTGDFDEDGDSDIFVANDEMPNYFYRNDGKGNFEEAGLVMGTAVNSLGAASGSMGVDAGDLDGDGRTDLFVTTFENEYVNLFRMTEQQMYQEVTRQSRIGEGSLPQVTWGCCLADLDSDGDRDVYIATGHLDRRRDNAYYQVADMVMRNMYQDSGQLRFENVTAGSPDIVQTRGASRGSGVADLDLDGDLDIVVLNLDQQPALIENRSPKAQWLKLKLVGRASNRPAVGAKVKVTAGKLSQVDEVRNGRGYQSSWGSELHFGLASNLQVDQIEITWPSGQRQELSNIATNQTVLVVEP